MTLTHARALVPSIVAVNADPEGEKSGLERLAAWAARRFSPFAAPDPPDGLWLDISGCSHLFGSETKLLDQLIARVEALGLAARAAIADTPGAAHAVVRFAPGGTATIVPAGGGADALAPLPIAALRLPPDSVAGLRRLGVERIGQLMTMHRAPIARRFGLEPFRRLDQALGAAPEPIDPIVPPLVPQSRRTLIEPVTTAEALARLIADLCSELCDTLAAVAKGARRLDLVFHRVDGRLEAVHAGTARATRDPLHLGRLLVPMLETVDPGLGIEAATLSAPLVEPLAPLQLNGTGGAPSEPDLAELIDRLAGRFGPARIYRVVPVESDLPERAVRRIAPLAPPTVAAWPVDLPRPARLVTPPEPVEAMALLPDHPPAAFTWRGRRYRVVRADGPERIHAEWWRGDTALGSRDYFQVEVEGGGRYWLFRAGDGENPATGDMRWYLHGAFG